MAARDDTPEQSGPRECLACRTTGRVISGLGGENHEVVCPWCEGTGVVEPGHDAQVAGAALRAAASA
jgi:DnaJ-class molecular chaperone